MDIKGGLCRTVRCNKFCQLACHVPVWIF